MSEHLVTNDTHPDSGELDALVGDWLDWTGAGEALGVSVSRVRQLVREHQLAAALPRKGSVPSVPAALLDDGAIVKGVPGLLTMLHDARFSDEEAIRWLFSPDESLPGRPIDWLRENRGSEIKRRAQALL